MNAPIVEGLHFIRYLVHLAVGRAGCSFGCSDTRCYVPVIWAELNTEGGAPVVNPELLIYGWKKVVVPQNMGYPITLVEVVLAIPSRLVQLLTQWAYVFSYSGQWNMAKAQRCQLRI